MFGPRIQTITVSSDPPDATVLINGNLAGRTPLRYDVVRSENLHLEIRKAGYGTQFRTASRNLSTFGILDAIGTCVILVPAFGLISPAAWEHYPGAFGIILVPKEEGAGDED
jgi:hypothetical protein